MKQWQKRRRPIVIAVRREHCRAPPTGLGAGRGIGLVWVETPARKVGKPGRPGAEPMGRVGRRVVYQREGPRLSISRGAVPGARPYPVGAAVLWGAGRPGPVQQCPALARALWRAGGGGPVLL